MKRIIILTVMLLTLTVTARAMSYEQAREQALFLTDKMAYELNLNEEQYDAAYEVNLDYLMRINTPDDLYEAYWRQRNLDLSYILLDWQYQAFCAASYFYRPIYWTSGGWHFAIYSRYPRRNYLYFGHTNIYVTYRGGHSWHHNGGHSWYKGRTFHHGATAKWNGLRDRFDKGDFRHNYKKPQPRTDKSKDFNSKFRGNKNNMLNKRPQNNNRQHNGYNFRGNRESSTRTTARPNQGTKLRNSTQKQPSNIFTPKANNKRTVINKNASTIKSFNRGNKSGNGRNKQSGGNKGGGRGGKFGGKK